MSGHFSEAVLDQAAIPSAAQVSALFETDDDALLLTDADGQIISVSSEWVLLCGSDTMMDGTAQGSEIADLLHRVRHDRQPRAATIYNHHGRGFQLKLDATIVPVTGDDGHVTGFLARLRPAP